MKQRAQLPKNIKQVGQKDGVFRIYLEDYVNTFINKIRESEEESNIPKIGILKRAILSPQVLILILTLIILLGMALKLTTNKGAKDEQK